MKKLNINITELAQRAVGLVSTAQLVARHNMSPSTISYLARKKGFAPLKRGRKTFAKPTEQQIEILKAIRMETLNAVGSRYGFSRQYVWSLAKRWADYPLPDEPQVLEVKSVHPAPAEITAANKEVRPFVISFRLTAAQMNRLRGCTAGNLSANKTARQLLDKALDFVALAT